MDAPRRAIIGGPFDGGYYRSSHALVCSAIPDTKHYAIHRLADDGVYRFVRSCNLSEFDLAFEAPEFDGEKGVRE